MNFRPKRDTVLPHLNPGIILVYIPWKILVRRTCWSSSRAPSSTRPALPPAEPQGGGEPLQQCRHAHSGKNTCDRSEREHEPHHDPSEVPGQRAVDDDEYRAVGGSLVEEPQADGRQGYQDVEVEVEGCPSGRLVLRHRRDDGDVPNGRWVGCAKGGGGGRAYQSHGVTCESSPTTYPASGSVIIHAYILRAFKLQ